MSPASIRVDPSTRGAAAENRRYFDGRRAIRNKVSGRKSAPRRAGSAGSNRRLAYIGSASSIGQAPLHVEFKDSTASSPTFI